MEWLLKGGWLGLAGVGKSWLAGGVGGCRWGSTSPKVPALLHIHHLQVYVCSMDMHVHSYLQVVTPCVGVTSASSPDVTLMPLPLPFPTTSYLVQVKAMPTLNLKIAGRDFTLTPEQYVLKVDAGECVLGALQRRGGLGCARGLYCRGVYYLWVLGLGGFGLWVGAGALQTGAHVDRNDTWGSCLVVQRFRCCWLCKGQQVHAAVC
jgi:hypothetical protein